ncbi:MAG: heavy metal-binding domain-containing protein [Candidatus Saccharibacteria bacterium]
MHPEIQQATPGECPTCGMNLAPVSNKAGGLVRRLFGRRDHNA